MASYTRNKKTGELVLKSQTKTPDQAAAQAAERAKAAASPQPEAPAAEEAK